MFSIVMGLEHALEHYEKKLNIYLFIMDENDYSLQDWSAHTNTEGERETVFNDIFLIIF